MAQFVSTAIFQLLGQIHEEDRVRRLLSILLNPQSYYSLSLISSPKVSCNIPSED